MNAPKLSAPLRDQGPAAVPVRLVPRLSLELFDRIDDASPLEWAALLPPERLFLHPDFLSALELSRPPRIRFRYAVWRSEGRVCAVAAFQHLTLTVAQCPGLASDAFNEGEGPFAGTVRRAARWAISKRAWQVLLCGNVFISGEHGFHADASLEPSLALASLAEGMERIAAREPTRPDFLLVKEYAPGECAPLRSAGFVEAPLDAGMTLRLSPSWRDLDDYAAALNSRCRGHLRRAREAAREVNRRVLSAAEISARADEIDPLYEAVLSRARVVPSTLDAAAFARFAEALGPRFALIAYEWRGRLVGFNTRFHRGSVVESYHLGLDDELATTLGLYRNTLYDDIAYALEVGAREVSFGRGAHEVKSSFGAEPAPVACAFRHASPALTALFRPLASFMVAPSWTPRRAFRSP